MADKSVKSKDLTFKELASRLESKDFSPAYILYGEEEFFINKIIDLAENNILTDSEKGFNFEVFYGSDSSATTIIAAARAYPMMAKQRVILVKDAHKLKKDDVGRIGTYLTNPVPTTVMLLIIKGESKIDSKFTPKNISSTVQIFQAKRLYENQIGTWIDESILRPFEFKIYPDARDLVVASLGNNLTAIESELTKIVAHLKTRNLKVIDKNTIHDFIHIDRDYNVFELMNALGERNVVKSHLIMHHLLINIKNNPSIMIISQLYGYFTELALLKNQNISDSAAAGSLLKKSPFIAKDYVAASGRYTYQRLLENMQNVLEADLAIKGVRSTNMGEEHILKTLIYKLLA